MHPYVELAKKAVEEYIKNKKIIPPPEKLAPEMKKKAGVFICLKKHGELRGCIGTFVPCEENIYKEIVKNAVSAAMEDPRFPKVAENELPGIQYSVDVLSEPEKVEDISSLDPRKYGVIVTKGFRKGLLLPDLEGVNTVEEQLHITKMKAGINPADKDIEIFKFTVDRYK
ncbi:MAG TPA: AMMECR1 domain-containing protein [Nitrospiraceae bacterium]|nr:MAG: AMMECR1 domain-containing protein [Nitrospirae bacterium GWA2_46_11]OGW23839.1 MAG: AMMECR1 domain-containing protein [Nitrospirae bacterium GWB2_47_37]HAK88502.1 AMMECR1 domain-containing protein [Nitrospiraceae bacterium]HCZ10929.1 AMMECR1 domain-containing protein [Nitrospiraceae bacterium]